VIRGDLEGALKAGGGRHSILLNQEEMYCVYNSSQPWPATRASPSDPLLQLEV